MYPLPFLGDLLFTLVLFSTAVLPTSARPLDETLSLADIHRRRANLSCPKISYFPVDPSNNAIVTNGNGVEIHFERQIGLSCYYAMVLDVNVPDSWRGRLVTHVDDTPSVDWLIEFDAWKMMQLVNLQKTINGRVWIIRPEPASYSIRETDLWTNIFTPLQGGYLQTDDEGRLAECFLFVSGMHDVLVSVAPRYVNQYGLLYQDLDIDSLRVQYKKYVNMGTQIGLSTRAELVNWKHYKVVPNHNDPKSYQLLGQIRNDLYDQLRKGSFTAEDVVLDGKTIYQGMCSSEERTEMLASRHRGEHWAP